MNVFVPFLALVIGLLAGMMLRITPVTGVLGQYLAIMCLAGLDTVVGGIRSGLEGKFTNHVFISGFVGNVLIAFFFAWLGDLIYVNLFLVVALVLGGRIFNNLSLIRRQLLTKWQDNNEKKRRQNLAQSTVPE